MVKDSFVSCTITTSTDGSEENKIHFLKAGQPGAATRSRLEVEMKKVKASSNLDKFLQDPFASVDDNEEADNNEACVNEDEQDSEADEEEEDKDVEEQGG